MTGDLLLKVSDLGISFDSEDIIKSVSFELKKGEVIGIIGPNGAGKTILLSSLLGLIPYKGKIEFAKGVEIGYLPQKLEMNSSLAFTVEEFLNLNFTPKVKAAIKKRKILETLSFLHSEDLISRQMAHLSRGQVQRVLFVSTLLRDPNVLLLDEPMSGVDPSAEETIYRHIFELKNERNTGIIFVSHDLNMVSKFADKVLCLNKTITCFGAPMEALTSENLTFLFKDDVRLYKHKHEHIF
jgi:zinc transport system ATP-binding protein